jgi:hypothetical protein
MPVTDLRRKGSYLVTCEREVDGWIFTAWETPVADHGETRTIKGVTWGRVDLRPRENTPLPTDTIARYEVCESWQRSQRDRAYQAIRALYPEAREAMRIRGRLLSMISPEVALTRGKRKKGEDRDAEAPPSFAGSGGAEVSPMDETSEP